jgi:ACS family hexuronate transporter-like MFS transporter
VNAGDGAPAPGPVAGASGGPGVPGRVRWTVCALLFAATTLSYLDRGVLGVLAPTLKDQLHWSETDYSHVVMAFQAAYAIGLALAGYLLDLVGVRLGYALAVALWSLAAVGHALVGSVLGFGAMRFLLGLGEAANFPAAIKSVGQWFPLRERALSTGIFNAGASIGAIAAPLLALAVIDSCGWQGVFALTGAVGLAWPVAWWWWYRNPRDHPRLGAAERALIEDGAPVAGPAPTLGELLRLRATWAFIIGKALTDPVWWFYLYWFPKFLTTVGIELKGLPLPMVTVYLVADIGSISGGWLSSRLIARGWRSAPARLAAMLAAVLCVLPVAAAPAMHSLGWAVALVALAAAGHQGWSANLFTLVSDQVPRGGVATVVGIGGTAGALGGLVMAQCVGTVLDWGGGYQPLFITGALVYVIALVAVRRLLPGAAVR